MSYTYNSANLYSRGNQTGFVYPGSFRSAPVNRSVQGAGVYRSTQGVIARNNYSGYSPSPSTSSFSTCPCARGRR